MNHVSTAASTCNLVQLFLGWGCTRTRPPDSSILWRKAVVVPLLLWRATTHPPLIFCLLCGENIPSVCFPVCTHILGVLPSRQIALGTARHIEPWFLPVLYLLLCSFAPVCHRQPADGGSRANRHSTQWTRRIILVEGRDRDRSSHNSPHHQYFTPSREANKSILLLQIIISTMQYLAHLGALRKELQQRGFISGVLLHGQDQPLICLWQIPDISHW